MKGGIGKKGGKAQHLAGGASRTSTPPPPKPPPPPSYTATGREQKRDRDREEERERERERRREKERERERERERQRERERENHWTTDRNCPNPHHGVSKPTRKKVAFPSSLVKRPMSSCQFPGIFAHIPRDAIEVLEFPRNLVRHPWIPISSSEVLLYGYALLYRINDAYSLKLLNALNNFKKDISSQFNLVRIGLGPLSSLNFGKMRLGALCWRNWVRIEFLFIFWCVPSSHVWRQFRKPRPHQKSKPPFCFNSSGWPTRLH